MKKIYGLAVGASLAVAAFAAAPATAMPLASGLSGPVADAQASLLIEQVQFRGRGRVGGPRYVAPRYAPRYGRRGIGPGGAIAAGAALGILGAAAAASAAPGYYAPAPAYGYGCYYERRPVYDAWGNPRGTHPVQVCR